jgi:hypothetical protein
MRPRAGINAIEVEVCGANGRGSYSHLEHSSYNRKWNLK